MAGTHAPARDGRLIAFYVVVIAFMAVSIGGQIQTTAPRIGGFFAFLWSAGNDAGALLALDCLMTAARRSPVKPWAWCAVLLAAGAGGAFNAYHVMIGVPAPAPAPFPLWLGLILGLESIVMTLILSHIIVTARAEQRPATSGPGDSPAAPDHEPDHAGDHAPGHAGGPARPRTATTSSAQPATSPTTSPTTSPAARSALPAATRSPMSAPGAGAGLVATTGGSGEGRPVRAGRGEPGGRDGVPAAPRLRVAPPPDPARPDWMTDDLIRDVVACALDAGAPAKRYGERRVMDDHRLTSWKAQQVLAYIKEHDLLAKAAS